MSTRNLAVSRTLRDARPSHYSFRIESFSVLLKERIYKLESDEFEVGGYKWGLCLYPRGEKHVNVDGNVSLYLAIKDTDKLPDDWEVNVEFKLFVYDHILDKYLVIQDVVGKTRRYDSMKTEWGIVQLLPPGVFNDTSKGYLFNDSCVFGAEIFIIKYSGKRECVTWMNESSHELRARCYTWKIDKFSEIKSVSVISEEFTIGKRKWTLQLYPRGNSCQNITGKGLSLFLAPSFAELPPKLKFYARFKMWIEDQVLHDRHHERQTQCWFSDANPNWGSHGIVELGHLKSSLHNLLKNDTLTVGVEILAMSMVKK